MTPATTGRSTVYHIAHFSGNTLQAQEGTGTEIARGIYDDNGATNLQTLLYDVGIKSAPFTYLDPGDGQSLYFWALVSERRAANASYTLDVITFNATSRYAKIGVQS